MSHKYLRRSCPRGSKLLYALLAITFILFGITTTGALCITVEQNEKAEVESSIVAVTDDAAGQQFEKVEVTATAKLSHNLSATNEGSQNLIINVPAQVKETEEPTEKPTELEVEELVLEASDGSRYQHVGLTEYDLDLLVKIIWLEARGEPYRGKQAVAEVVFNRMVHGLYFPDTLYEVIYEEEPVQQFPTVKLLHLAKPTEVETDIIMEAIEQALNGPNVLPMNVVFFATEPENDNVWGEIGGHVFCYPWDF